MSDLEDAESLFWELADAMISAGAAHEGTMMGTRCLRVDGEFLAMVSQKIAQLVVKLPESRVAEVIYSGSGSEFSPAGRKFREWVAVDEVDRNLWQSLLDEGRNFIAPS
ncbi:MAG: hypothetical protein P8N02_07885 [Actinomycetota bacterium]|jgi:hypothetical protein|nr:hypothetical protein [Actinomycetota bacterium]